MGSNTGNIWNVVENAEFEALPLGLLDENLSLYKSSRRLEWITKFRNKGIPRGKEQVKITYVCAFKRTKYPCEKMHHSGLWGKTKTSRKGQGSLGSGVGFSVMTEISCICENQPRLHKQFNGNGYNLP